MILWASVVGAILVTAGAVGRFLSRARPPKRRDPDWGDWPPDHMAQ